MSSNDLTWDQATPKRPGIDDVGGGAKENDPRYPPNPAQHPTAEDFNQISKQIVALGKMAPIARLLLTFTAGTPTLQLISAPSMNLVVGDFSLLDMGNGDTRVTVAANKIPAIAGGHLTQQDTTDIDRIRFVLTTAVQFRVQTFLGGVGTDCAVLIDLV